MRKLIYKQDHQMYEFTPIIFETNSSMSVEEMQKLSYEPRGAGRHSTSFDVFKELMISKGHTIKEIERLSKNVIPETNLELVIGATGNY